MAIPCNSSVNETRDTFALQHLTQSLPYVNFRELTPASQTALIGCFLLTVGLASTVVGVRVGTEWIRRINVATDFRIHQLAESELPLQRIYSFENDLPNRFMAR
jgi:hypothetical protein